MSKLFTPIRIGALELSHRAQRDQRHPFLNFPQQGMQQTCDFQLYHAAVAYRHPRSSLALESEAQERFPPQPQERAFTTSAGDQRCPPGRSPTRESRRVGLLLGGSYLRRAKGVAEISLRSDGYDQDERRSR